MTQKPVLKIMKPGKSLDSTDLRDYIFHSDHTCFKIHTISSGSITINPGVTDGYVDISHNLGYVPAFLVYEDGQLLPEDVECYADTSKIRITKRFANLSVNTYYASDVYNENGWIDDDSGELTQWFYAGKGIDGDGSAIRWSNILVGQGVTISNANLDLNHVFTDAGSDIKFKIWGIDEDNTESFSGSPMGRTKTTAERVKTQSAITSDFNFGDDITTLIQEVVNRGGWSSGNAFGIILNDNGSDSNHWIRQYVENRISDNLVLTLTVPGASAVTSNYKVVVFKDKIA